MVVRVLPHWNHAEGETVRVATFTNGDKAELFVNGVSHGVKEVQNRRAEWNVPFAKGEITVVATRAAETATDTVKTAGSPCRLDVQDVTPNQKNPSSRILNVGVVDENGTLVPNLFDAVQFSVNGGRILGVGNGNPNGHFDEQASEVPLFHSRAQIIVEGKTNEITVTCGNLPPITMRFQKE